MEDSSRARGVCELLRAAQQAEREAQTRQLVLTTELVDAYATVEGPALPGSERLVPSGAEGTPGVAEFIAAELGPLLGESIPVAWSRIRDAVNLRHRLPILWAAVLDGVVPAWQARQVARDTAKLGLEACLLVDARMRPAWGRLTWARLRRRLAGLVVDADRELAAREAAQRASERFVQVRHEGYGSSLVTARLDTADAVALQDAVDALARCLVAEGRREPLPVLRSIALGELARPDDGSSRLPRPQATLVVHVARETVADPTTGVVRCDEVGPLLLDQVRRVLGHARVSVLPVVDLATDPGVDCYEVPAHVDRHVRARDPFSCFPFSGARAVAPGRSADLDHTQPYRVGGAPRQTRASNLAPLARGEHRPKTFGWRCSHPAPGVLEWESPLGFHYRVRAGRTIPITAAQVMPWDRTGRVHYYPPPDDVEVDLAAFRPPRE